MGAVYGDGRGLPSLFMPLMMKRLYIVFLLSMALLPSVHAQVAAQQLKMAKTFRWTGTWATAPQFITRNNMSARTELTGKTVRQIVHVSLGGNTLRLQLSNAYSKSPLYIKSVYIANSLDSSAIDVHSARYLEFAKKRAVVIPAGQSVMSDALQFHLKPLQRLAITINYGNAAKDITWHPGSRTTSYLLYGVSVPRTKFAHAAKADYWYTIDAIDVYGVENGSIAILGNSITDGRGSTTNHQNRWPDIMSERLGGRLGVLNLGIGGNEILGYGLGDPAVKRFGRDILGQRGLKAVIIFEGTNDIGHSRGNSEQVAAQMIEAYVRFAKEAHARGLKVFGATITPFKNHSYYTPFHEAARETVNEWIRTTKDFDGVIDFDKLMSDPNEPKALIPECQEDWLHPNAEGYRRMGHYAAERMAEFGF